MNYSRIIYESYDYDDIDGQFSLYYMKDHINRNKT
jgi:hypothetical protein